jgi:predicted TIM-barrel fold metal-dependent hydrolase
MAERLIIDAHMHLYQSADQGARNKSGYSTWEYGAHQGVRFSDKTGEPTEARKAMRRAGISHALVVNLFATAVNHGELVEALPGPANGEGSGGHSVGERLVAYNRWLVDQAQTDSAFIPFVAVDPWALSSLDTVTHLRAMAQSGARGVKIHPVVQRFHAADKRMSSIYESCIELGLVVMAHSGPSRDAIQHAELKAYAEVLSQFPGLNLILAHLGGGSWTQAAEFAADFPNAYFDCSEILSWIGSANGPTADQLAKLILTIGPERVLFGTDYPWYDLDVYVEMLDELPLLNQDQTDAIAGANAASLIGL